MDPANYPLLHEIDTPRALRRLPEARLGQVVDELRRFLIDTIGECGGHFAANLGTVELTVALHYVYQTPEDRLVWDVGHQTYPHKILTGRADALNTIRRHRGLAPFPRRDESPYDTFGVGHSSTSISAALGMALAAREQGHRRRIAAIIGDGAMTAGLAYEALNHGAHQRADMLTILNDNEMSISPNVGGLSSYLSRVLSSRSYHSLREGGKTVLRRMPPMWEFARRAEAHAKGMLIPGTLFEEMGWNYIGPIDGHDVDLLVRTLRKLRELPGPQFLHVVTVKGKGYPPAEADPVKWHGVSSFDPDSGQMKPKRPGGPSYSQVFGRWLCEAATADPRIIAITPAMREGSGLVEYEQKFPHRYHDVGICEQHAVTFAAGLACEGMRPVVAIYSTFLQRAYDQVIHDITVQGLAVLFAVDRAGLVGADGVTHHGAYDLSFLRTLPGFVVMAPADEQECRQMLTTGLGLDGPAAVRYPRGSGPGRPIEPGLTPLPLGKGEVRRRGRSGIAVLAFGAPLSAALDAAEAIDATVANMRFVKPLDEELILRLAEHHWMLVTVEENVVAGGAGSAVAEALARHGRQIVIHHIGLPDRLIHHGSREALLAEVGLDAPGLTETLRQLAEAAPGYRLGPSGGLAS